MTKYHLYVCPECGSGSWTMEPLDEFYTPTAADEFLYPELMQLAAEILLCPCGLKLTWFDMKLLEKTRDERLLDTDLNI